MVWDGVYNGMWGPRGEMNTDTAFDVDLHPVLCVTRSNPFCLFQMRYWNTSNVQIAYQRSCERTIMSDIQLGAGLRISSWGRCITKFQQDSLCISLLCLASVSQCGGICCREAIGGKTTIVAPYYTWPLPTPFLYLHGQQWDWKGSSLGRVKLLTCKTCLCGMRDRGLGPLLRQHNNCSLSDSLGMVVLVYEVGVGDCRSLGGEWMVRSLT